MENRKFIKPKILIFLGIFILLVSPNFSHAYSPKSTHKALTQETLKLYSSKYSGVLTNNDWNDVMNGSVEEDNPLDRTFNHFYDPVNNKAMIGG